MLYASAKVVCKNLIGRRQAYAITDAMKLVAFVIIECFLWHFFTTNIYTHTHVMHHIFSPWTVPAITYYIYASKHTILSVQQLAFNLIFDNIEHAYTISFTSNLCVFFILLLLLTVWLHPNDICSIYPENIYQQL